jgi:hypothetical protein
MTQKNNAPLPDHQRIRVPQGRTLQIYSRDARGNKMLMSLPGPVDISMVPLSTGNRVTEVRKPRVRFRRLPGIDCQESPNMSMAA